MTFVQPVNFSKQQVGFSGKNSSQQVKDDLGSTADFPYDTMELSSEKDGKGKKSSSKVLKICLGVAVALVGAFFAAKGIVVSKTRTALKKANAQVTKIFEKSKNDGFESLLSLDKSQSELLEHEGGFKRIILRRGKGKKKIEFLSNDEGNLSEIVAVTRRGKEFSFTQDEGGIKMRDKLNNKVIDVTALANGSKSSEIVNNISRDMEIFNALEKRRMFYLKFD